MMRNCCQSSVMARRTAASVTSRPSACLSCGDGRVARLQQLVGLNRQLRNLRASRSVAGCGASRGRRAAHTRRAEPRLATTKSGCSPGWPSRFSRTATPSVSRRTSSSSARAMCFGSGSASRRPATASTNEGAMEEENCRRGRKRHNPVSSIHVRASSKVSVPCPFWRILSARDASNCSAVKEKPHFQAGV